MSSERMKEYLDTNVLGLHHVVKHFLPVLRNGDGKNIIIMSSSSGSIKKNVTEPKGLCGPYVCFGQRSMDSSGPAEGAGSSAR